MTWDSIVRRPRATRRYTRLRFGGRQPLWGMGVTSRMDAMSRPAPERARIADSRPEPGPFTYTSTRRSPRSCASRAAAVAATCAAYGVFFRLPLKPILPELAHEITLPYWSVNVTITLLNVAFTYAWPFDSTMTFFLRTDRPPFCCLFAILTLTGCRILFAIVNRPMWPSMDCTYARSPAPSFQNRSGA